jgi:hypothetical protein
MPLLMLAIAMLFSACGGGGTDTTVTPPDTSGSTGTIVMLLTDAPVDELSAIYLDVTDAWLIGDMGQQMVFSGKKTINLLDLENFDQPIVIGEVAAGNYNKIRLRIENLELVDKNTGVSTFLSLPANGKIDLLERNGFTVFPGKTLLVEIDIDANKSIHIVGTGSGKYNFRPVVKVNILDGGLPAKLIRLEGIVAELLDDLSGKFLLCHADDAESCIIVNLAEGGSVFDAAGLPTGIETLMVNDPVVAIGALRHEDDEDGDSDSDSDSVDMDLELDAIVVEIGGNATQTKGVVVSAPDVNGKFQIVDGTGETVTVLLQDGTKIFSKDGELSPDAIVVDQTIVVEGVVVPSDDPATADAIYAALIFMDDAVEGEVLLGKIVVPLDPDNESFVLATDVGDLCVKLADEAKIILVLHSDDGTVIEKGEFSDLEAGQKAAVFGHSGVGGCFQTEEVVVEET